MFLSYYALEKLVEIRIAERREEAARERTIAAAERPAPPEPPSPIRWIQVQLLGR